MFCRFGAPLELHSDQGRNFKAQVFAEWRGSTGRLPRNWLSSPHKTSETVTATYPLSYGLIAQRCKSARGAHQPHLCSAESCGCLWT